MIEAGGGRKMKGGEEKSQGRDEDKGGCGGIWR